MQTRNVEAAFRGEHDGVILRSSGSNGGRNRAAAPAAGDREACRKGGVLLRGAQRERALPELVGRDKRLLG
jgi:hypothetical protein